MTVTDFLQALAAIVAIIGGIYGFYKWWRPFHPPRPGVRKGVSPTPLAAATVMTLASAQRKALEELRLFDFGRGINLSTVYVPQVLFRVERSPLAHAFISPRSSDPEDRVFQALTSTADGPIQIVVGGAGSGKTTMLRKWALDLVSPHLAVRSSKPRHETTSHPIPAYVALRFLRRGRNGTKVETDLQECFKRTIPGLTDELAAIPFQCIRRLKDSSADPSGQASTRTSGSRSAWCVIFRRFRRGESNAAASVEWILLLDGLDEAPTDLQSDVTHWAQGLPSKVRVGLAARKDACPSLTAIAHSDVYEVANFSDEQVKDFVTRWFAAKPNLGNDLLKQLDTGETRSALRSLSSVPLLLACICIHVELQGSAVFPTNFVDRKILQSAVEILLDRWQAAKADRPVNQQRLQLGMKVFTQLAVRHINDRQFSREELEQTAQGCARELGIADTEVKGFLAALSTSGQLVENLDESRLTFGHEQFFQYFVACSPDY